MLTDRDGVRLGPANLARLQCRLDTLCERILVRLRALDASVASPPTPSNQRASSRNPDQLKRLQAQPALVDNSVEEMLRFVSPVRPMMRTGTRDTELAGHPVATGDWLLLSSPAANFDPAVFTDPAAFDIARPNTSSHLAFGYGRHFCLGAQLARMEMRTLFRALDTIDFAARPTLTRATFVGGLNSVPIRYTRKG